MKSSRKNLLYKKNVQRSVPSNTRRTTKKYLLPSRSMKSTALPNNQDFLVDNLAELETLEDLFSAPSTARLRRDCGSLRDSQGHSIMRIGEQI